MRAIKRVLICPLDWGLGHASRCIPIIRSLLEADYEVLIATDEMPYRLLLHEFPQLTFIRFKGYGVRYSRHFFMLQILLQAPKIAWGILREHHVLKRIIKAHHIDLVISDNRFGCWNKTIPSVFITHQVFIQTPFLQNLIRKINFAFIKKYQQIWIPDVEGEPNFSGQLAHATSIPKHAHYIGTLSRFNPKEKKTAIHPKYDLCMILSGPEPQRSLLEALLIRQIRKYPLRCILIRGLVDADEQLNNLPENLQALNHASSAEFQEHIANSKQVIARSGYSTIMDLAALGARAIFVPTPGQTEQEYLAKIMMENGLCFSQEQAKLDLKSALLQSEKYQGFSAKTSNQMQKETLLKRLAELNLRA